ncbi:putative alkaline shock family protein YloU [Kineococcus rhizosphaerae]|uniref:Putative alkaline shock family protein YloU n=1 Tax=Kineococcus rhizosphaerae TaxID=559628 RepID=A0A2T0R4T8_9ACTN|nr:putative alkaline shock family protein YloU [Kineococcus rhizosphaerae]
MQRLTTAAAREVDGVAAAADSSGSLGALGSALGRDYPRVDCEVAGNRVRASVQIATVWPYPAAQVAAAVRDHVRDRLAELADLHADAVHVSVEKVVRASSTASTSTRRRVQ